MSRSSYQDSQDSSLHNEDKFDINNFQISRWKMTGMEWTLANCDTWDKSALYSLLSNMHVCNTA